MGLLLRCYTRFRWGLKALCCEAKERRRSCESGHPRMGRDGPATSPPAAYRLPTFSRMKRLPVTLGRIPRFRSDLKGLLLLIAVLLAFPVQAQPRKQPVPGDYLIIDGKVDRGTYTGWRIFHTACFGCHGVGGVGTEVAPNLVERVQQMTPRAFATKVLTSYRIVPPVNGANSEDAAALRESMLEDILRRQRGVGAAVRMPAWEADMEVDPHVLDLFAYLSARADGLGPGKPERWGVKKKR